MILLIDNYDSFSYNLYQLIGSMDDKMEVHRNNQITIQEIREMNPQLIVLSPGPGKPEDAGICPQVVKELGGEYPILGVCLGHQVICQVYGATVTYASRMMHGKTSTLKVAKENRLFAHIEEPITVARYHSLSAKEDTIPECLKITAKATDDQEVMAVEHKEYPIYGVQFHPESILTSDGAQMIRNIISQNK